MNRQTDGQMDSNTALHYAHYMIKTSAKSVQVIIFRHF